MKRFSETFLAWLFFAIILCGGVGLYLYIRSDSSRFSRQREVVESEKLRNKKSSSFEKKPKKKSGNDQALNSKREIVKPPRVRQSPPSARQQVGRHPPGLSEESVFFKVIENGYAVAQGDVLLGKVKPEQAETKQGAYRPAKTKLWPSEVIPYAIKEEVKVAGEIEKAIDYFHRHTPIRFVQVSAEDENAVVFIHSEEHCASYLGMAGGLQPILISPRCAQGEVMHEIMHALGFVHEHSREDRDQYIEVIWENIKEEFLPQFNIVPDQLIHNYTGSVFSFDPESIMLYPPGAFAKGPGLITLKSKGRVELNPAVNELSRLDKERLFYLYGL